MPPVVFLQVLGEAFHLLLGRELLCRLRWAGRLGRGNGCRRRRRFRRRNFFRLVHALRAHELTALSRSAGCSARCTACASSSVVNGFASSSTWPSSSSACGEIFEK